MQGFDPGPLKKQCDALITGILQLKPTVFSPIFRCYPGHAFDIQYFKIHNFAQRILIRITYEKMFDRNRWRRLPRA